MSYVVASSKVRLEPLLFLIYRIHLVFVMSIAFINALAPEFAAQIFRFAVVSQDGSNRISGFATEPSYEAFLITFLWFVLFKSGEMNDFWTALGVASLLFLESLFGLFLAALIAVELLGNKRVTWIYKILFFIVGSLVSIVQLGDSYLSDKISVFLATFSDLENGPGAVRIAPYLYLNQIGWVDSLSFFGNGAGTFGGRYFDEYGFMITERTTLSGHMAELLYDYGIILFGSLFIFCCAHFPARNIVSVPLTLLVFLNTGVGSYLFVTYLIVVLQGIRYDKEVV
jgi:hypothetical protein